MPSIMTADVPTVNCPDVIATLILKAIEAVLLHLLVLTILLALER